MYNQGHKTNFLQFLTDMPSVLGSSPSLSTFEMNVQLHKAINESNWDNLIMHKASILSEDQFVKLVLTCCVVAFHITCKHSHMPSGKVE